MSSKTRQVLQAFCRCRSIHRALGKMGMFGSSLRLLGSLSDDPINRQLPQIRTQIYIVQMKCEQQFNCSNKIERKHQCRRCDHGVAQ